MFLMRSTNGAEIRDLSHGRRASNWAKKAASPACTILIDEGDSTFRERKQ